MTRLRLGGCTALCLLLWYAGPSGQAGMAARIDAIVEAPIRAGKIAGASVAVVKGGDTLVLKGYGLADLELDVPTPPKATYEIGSVTKQFTAAAILLLAEEGKLSLDDDLAKFLPDYPTGGRRVTIRRLLNHTSGIKGYTEIPEFREFQMLKRPREELVALFGSKPLEFTPGDEQIYNNSAFFLLGLIIEQVSGAKYEDFVQTRIFDSVGMKDSYYCSERTVRKNHAHGYDTDQAGGLVLKGYLDHSWPVRGGLAVLEHGGSGGLEPGPARRQGAEARVLPGDDHARRPQRRHASSIRHGDRPCRHQRSTRHRAWRRHQRVPVGVGVLPRR